MLTDLLEYICYKITKTSLIQRHTCTNASIFECVCDRNFLRQTSPTEWTFMNPAQYLFPTFWTSWFQYWRKNYNTDCA